MLSRWLHTARGVLRRGAVNEEIDRELAFHLEMQTRQLMSEGVSREEARRRALLTFGGVDRFAEECLDTRRTRWLDEIRQDLRIAVRGMRSAPGFTAVMLLTLAMGIGATTAVFSVVYGILLRPLPYREADRLMMVWENDRTSGTVREAASIGDYNDFVRRTHSFAALATYATAQYNLLTESGEPVRVSAAHVTHTMPATLGIASALGRFISAAEDVPQGARTAVLTDRVWRSQFGGRKDVLGRLIRLDDVAYQVVGVLPASVEFPDAGTDIWLPLGADASTTDRNPHNVTVVGRLRPDATVASAQTEMAKVMADLERENEENLARGAFVEPIETVILGPVRRALVVLFAAVGLVLAIGCANLANLLLARATSRRREVAVRAALGASSARLARQFLVEVGLLVVLGAGLGIPLARALLGVLLALAPDTLPRTSGVAVSWMSMLFAVGIALVVSVCFGSVPAIDARRVRLQETLKSEGGRLAGGRTQARFRSTLVVAQITLSVLLVIGAGLLVRSFWLLQRVQPGFQTENVLRASFRLPVARYPQSYDNYPSWTQVHHFYDEVTSRLSRTPGVRSVAVATNHPLAPGFTNGIQIAGREAESENLPEMPTRPVSASYFKTMGVALLQGRGFDERDRTDGAPVMIINDAAARRYFPGTNPIGQRIRFWGTFREVIGVVSNERFYGLTEEAPPAMYPPMSQAPFGTASILIRADGPADDLAALVRQEVHAIDPTLALFDIESLRTTLDASVAPQRFLATLVGVFALIALLLSLVGVHGLISYAVAQRSREAGIRAALGATPGNVIGLLVAQGLRLGALGLLLGILAAVVASRLIRELLFGIGGLDLGTYAAVAGIIALSVSIAVYLPARRLAGVSPLSVLRE